MSMLIAYSTSLVARLAVYNSSPPPLPRLLRRTAADPPPAAPPADPFLLPKLQVDKGAIRFVLSGANIMCPGLTSPGARMTAVPEKTPVAIMAEGKQHALAVGLTKMSTDDM